VHFYAYKTKNKGDKMNSNEETVIQTCIRVFIGLLILALVVLAAGCAVERSTESTVVAQNGAQGPVGPSGAQGDRGEMGPQGLIGQTGQSCTLSANNLTCGASTIALPTGITISGYIKPCGAEFANDEIFLRMSDNNILALFDGGANLDRLVLLAPGNYQTTDRTGRTCQFTVTPSLQIINEGVR
jgi:hypothetical protein